LTDRDAIHPAEQFLAAYHLDNDEREGPPREWRLGPDHAGNLLEIVVLVLDGGAELVIHAMPMRGKYQDLLP
jgi:hypothetical protein